MTSETSENKIFVRFYFILCYLMLTWLYHGTVVRLCQLALGSSSMKEPVKLTNDIKQGGKMS